MNITSRRAKQVTATLAALTVIGTVSGCSTDADVVSQNLSKAADQFEIGRRVVFINNVTGTYELTIEGLCNIVTEENQLEVTCKAAGGEYKKHFLGLNETTTYVVEQLEGANVSADHYRVIFKPEVIVPDIDRP
ncbi:hypothetical protein [Rhodococcus aetherivorans]|uniref:beta-sandwich lipoprotein n=1 Tax=Rhodococcus aetherivorans TaxID=191292 RepID=UPI00389048DF